MDRETEQAVASLRQWLRTRPVWRQGQSARDLRTAVVCLLLWAIVAFNLRELRQLWPPPSDRLLLLIMAGLPFLLVFVLMHLGLLRQLGLRLGSALILTDHELTFWDRKGRQSAAKFSEIMGLMAPADCSPGTRREAYPLTLVLDTPDGEGDLLLLEGSEQWREAFAGWVRDEIIRRAGLVPAPAQEGEDQQLGGVAAWQRPGLASARPESGK